MLLVLDVGNTNTVLGLFDGDRLVGNWRVSSYDRTSDETALMLQGLLLYGGIPKNAVEGAILSSVVPRLEEIWCGAVKSCFGITPYIVTPAMDLRIAIDIDNPSEIGADRLVNSVAAVEKYGCPVVTVDLGTAITLDVVSEECAYIGGAIAPGLSVSMETLFSKTAKLPQIVLIPPKKVIGRNTQNAIQSGIVYGYVGLVDSLVERIFHELGRKTPVIATGGHAEILAKQSRTITNIEPWLTLDGLSILYKRTASTRE